MTDETEHECTCGNCGRLPLSPISVLGVLTVLLGPQRAEAELNRIMDNNEAVNIMLVEEEGDVFAYTDDEITEITRETQIEQALLHHASHNTQH